MTCAGFKELAAALALDALEPEEREACEAHLAEPEHEGCRDALAAARAAVHALPLALPPEPPPASVWTGIAGRLAGAGARPLRRRRWPIVAAVAALAAVVLLLVLLRDRAEEARLAGGRERTLAGARATALEDARREAVLRRVCLADLEALRAELEARREAVALLAAPGVRLIRLAPQAAGGGGQAVALIDAAGGRAVLVGHGLAAPAGMDYELWVIRGARKLPAGLLRLDASGALALSVDYTLLADGVDALAVTLEPTGGSPAPTGPIVLLGKAG